MAIVRAIATDPKLLLLDEITSALDPVLVGEVLDLVRHLKENGSTILMATHEMDFARRVADRVVFLADGLVVEQGPPSSSSTIPNGRRRATSSPACTTEAPQLSSACQLSKYSLATWSVASPRLGSTSSLAAGRWPRAWSVSGTSLRGA